MKTDVKSTDHQANSVEKVTDIIFTALSESPLVGEPFDLDCGAFDDSGSMKVEVDDRSIRVFIEE